MGFYFYFPPLRTITGGMQVIADLAGLLLDDGQSVVMVTQKADDRNCESLGLPSRSIQDIRPDKNDFWIAPEGWPFALAPGLAADCRCVVYAQNWAYVHGHLPAGTTWRDLKLSFWAVSSPVARFLSSTIGVDARIVRPAIDFNIFHCEGRSGGADLRIAWMPRKNSAISTQTRYILDAVRTSKGLPCPQWVEIDGRSKEEVAELMRACAVFFAAGFPEGCALPPLEAMACGCIVAGFAGFGDWDYMRQGLENGFRPAIPLPLRTWGPNGFYVPDADAFAAALALDRALNAAAEKGREYETIRENARHTANFYSRENQKKELFAACGLDKRL